MLILEQFKVVNNIKEFAADVNNISSGYDISSVNNISSVKNIPMLIIFQVLKIFQC